MTNNLHHVNKKPKVMPLLAATLEAETTSTVKAARLPTRRPFQAITDDTDITQRTIEMKNRISKQEVLSESELDDIVHSLENVLPFDEKNDIDLSQVRTLLKEVAHLSHKDWDVTDKNSQRLEKALFPNFDSVASQQLLERVLTEGNWKGAQEHASSTNKSKPWAVLVAGVNGIRKTTSIYQPWFSQLLSKALVAPTSEETTKTPSFVESSLPVGSNSFFRQLDHMIATLCNEDFHTLYHLTRQELQKTNEKSSGSAVKIPPELVKKYSDLKAAIFTRYRTLSELLGVFLLRQAQSKDMNCMMETSGRDVAMFTYVDHFFPNEQYNKLALHFEINDLSFAQQSVDERMIREIQTGLKATNAFDVIYANAGGPYGSEVLPGVQTDSDAVWKTHVISPETATVGQDWYKATIRIQALNGQPWTAQAVLPDGSLDSTIFTFQPPANRK